MYTLNLENFTKEDVDYAMGKAEMTLSHGIELALEDFVANNTNKTDTLMFVEGFKQAYMVCAAIEGIKDPLDDANLRINAILEFCVWDDGVVNKETKETIKIDELHDLCAGGKSYLS